MKHETIQVVTYIDLLGTKSKMNNMDSDKLFQQIQQLYSQIIPALTDNSMKQENIKAKVFSDNVIFTKETPDSSDAISINLNQMISIAASFQFFALLCGWPSRGGITVGPLYIDDTFVWGKGLLRAYQLENEIASFPRIVIDPKCFEEYVANSSVVQCWKIDGGLPIVDTFALMHNDSAAEPVRNAILKSKSKEDEKTIGKTEWLREQYNSWCKNMGYEQFIIA